MAFPHRRRFVAAVVVSLLLHALVLGLTPRKPSALAPGPIAHSPLNVVITPEDTARAESTPQPPVEAAAPPPTPRPITRPRKPVEPPPVAAVPVPVAPLPLPLPAPIPAPPVDMLAAVEARRAQRRALESAARGPPAGKPTEDAATRNLASLSGREGVGGVFQILRIGTRTAEFAFNGWKPDARSQWREVIEVDAGQGGNVELAIIRRMIELIRTHYKGDFHWESHRLGRTITLSARPEDQLGLEDVLVKEFFGSQTLNPRGR